MTTEEEKKKRREREALLLLFLLLIGDTYEHVTQQVTTYLTGNSSVHSLSRSFTQTLFGAHVQATYYGRRLAGVTQPMGESDQQFAQTVMAGQASFITGLLNDLSGTRYPFGPDGELPGSLTARLMLYARRLIGTGNEAWVMSLPEDTEIRWILGGCQHCPECPEIAQNGSYTAATLPSYPADGSTSCLSHCCCHLETADGQVAFRLSDAL